MAEIQVTDGQVTVHLSVAEKIGALHGDLHFPESAVRAVRVVIWDTGREISARRHGTGAARPWASAS